MNGQQLTFLEDVEDQIKQAIGNRNLIMYGIQNEVSDFRAHVTYPAMRTYVFPTAKAKAVIDQAEFHQLRLRTVTTDGIETAQGYAVPISYIDGIQEVVIPPDIWQRYRIHDKDETSIKGQLATSIVVELLQRDKIPLPVRWNHADSKALDIAGTDIVINASLHLQVKCDMRGGDKSYGGTGNLFIQIAECNPYKRY